MIYVLKNKSYNSKNLNLKSENFLDCLENTNYGLEQE